MVQEKTRNNLSDQESKILEEALKNSRLAFVEASGGTPASMMPSTPMPDLPGAEDDFVDQPAPKAPKAAEAKPADAPAAEPSENKKKFTKSYG
jgi:hypothetical protein